MAVEGIKYVGFNTEVDDAPEEIFNALNYAVYTVTGGSLFWDTVADLAKGHDVGPGGVLRQKDTGLPVAVYEVRIRKVEQTI